MSRELRNFEAKGAAGLATKIAFVSPAPMVSALMSRRMRDIQGSTPRPRTARKRATTKRTPKAVPGSVFDVQLSKQQRSAARAKVRASNKTSASGARRAPKERYNAWAQRPRTLAQARQWERAALVRSRDAFLNRSPGAERAHRVYQASQAVVSQWTASRRAPRGFRRGKG